MAGQRGHECESFEVEETLQGSITAQGSFTPSPRDSWGDANYSIEAVVGQLAAGLYKDFLTETKQLLLRD